MKQLLLFSLLFLSFSAGAQSIENTTWKVYLADTFYYYRLTADSVQYSADNTTYATQSAFWTSGSNFQILDNPPGICSDTGKYTYSISGDTMHFTLVTDACYIRASVLATATWVFLYPLQIITPAPASALLIFPNPVQGQLTVTAYAPATRYAIYNAMGMKAQAGALTGKHTTIDVHRLAAGFYFLQTDAPGLLPAKFEKY